METKRKKAGAKGQTLLSLQQKGEKPIGDPNTATCICLILLLEKTGTTFVFVCLDLREQLFSHRYFNTSSKTDILKKKKS